MFLNWGAFSACSKTCGEGKYSRTRECVGGICSRATTEDLFEVKTCKVKECPGKVKHCLRLFLRYFKFYQHGLIGIRALKPVEVVCKREQEHVTKTVMNTQLAIRTTIFQKLKVAVISPALQVRIALILSDGNRVGGIAWVGTRRWNFQG